MTVDDLPRTAAAPAVVPGTAAPSEPMVQLLTPAGERVAHPEFSLDISADEVRALYRDLVLVRRFDSEAASLQRQGELGLWTSSLGQEAAQVGSARALRPGDYAFPTFREHGVAWCRGVDPMDLMGMFRGVNHGGWNPADKNFHLYTIVIGAQTLHATGYAMGLAKDGAQDAVVAYFGDGASSQGDVSEAFNFAAVYGAPVVFFCQNNQWAISEPTDRQFRAPLHRRAAGFGFHGLRVDGNDVLACLAVTRWALERARAGEGPVLVEAFTYRMAPHSTSDDPSRYRPPGEQEAWEGRDPVARVRAYLLREEWADQDFFDGVDEEGEALARQLRAGIRGMPDPDPDLIFQHVYAQPHPLVAEERTDHAAYLAGFADDAPAPGAPHSGTKGVTT
ncbi:pyruvate dehydrogenase (acetyl-transferring) E1 component subunit alpha [Streptomyces sanglieri]|uniref:Pyruvate dehydrogenase (Acetyl-transferring) E1 component subunit alpha n=1 Tax=Streptomyces sanglieri TaxID=193460 RepID=A0ABW2WZN0_9ACTN